MCGVGQNLVTAQVVLPEANFNFFCLMLRKERRRDKNDNKKKGHHLAMEFTRKTLRGLWNCGDGVFCYLANSYQCRSSILLILLVKIKTLVFLVCVFLLVFWIFNSTTAEIHIVKRHHFRRHSPHSQMA